MSGLGRRHAPDPRDAAFPMRAALPKAVAPQSRSWRMAAALDQGQTSMCVGFSWKGFLLGSPMMTKSGPSPQDIYDQAQQIDEFPDTPPADGTSVRAGVKVLQNEGRIAQYLWTTNLSDVRDYVISRGPVVLGTNWYAQMDSLDSKGFARVEGSVRGGHAFLACGYHVGRKAFRCLNSWGVFWGQRGRFWLSEPDVARLLSEDGEACSAIEQRII